ncbi:outer membrane protein assembly factor BamB [Comamonas nitrativorans]|uniref:Outer membrane protein assembly factor BamB n=1 Tax=Comamonas nitrativorans TaxID=108437 RepID=A0ABV9GSV7_9BURK
MKPSSLPLWARRSALALAVVAGLAACGSKAPKPADLGPNVPVLPVRQAWHSSIPALKNASIAPQVVGQNLVLAAADGTVVSLDGATGREQWRSQVGKALQTGVGSDGSHAAVVTVANDLVVLGQGGTLWSKPLSAASYTAPLVAGGRVFVLTADRHLTAYDAQDGTQLWTLQRDGEPLVLRQQGVLAAHGNTLLAGLSGRLVALNPDNGVVLWEAPLATPRGTNDVERLVDLVGPYARNNDVVCARAFQASVGCVDVGQARLMWTAQAKGSVGIGSNSEQVFGAESNGTVQAWSRRDGAKQWSTERLQLRQLTAPLALGRSVVVGDSTGLVHLLSKDDGSPLNRLSTDSSGIAVAPVVVADTLVVVTRNGGVYGFRPD